jgi:glycosyltransferase domain-containing protein
MITLILLSHNNSKYLRRALSFYKQRHFKGRILVADSSHEAEKKKVKEILQEVKNDRFVPRLFDFLDNSDCAEKIIYALKEVCTPYVLLAGVDDFFSPTAIYELVRFLKTNLDYVFCHGYAYKFAFYGCELKFYYEGGINNRIVYHEQLALDRINKFFSSYTNVCYSVFRTSVLLDIFEKNYEYDLKSGFFEHSLSLFALLHGKGGFLKIPFLWREMDEQSLGTKNCGTWLLDEKFPEQVKNLEKLMIFSLKKKRGGDEASVREEAQFLTQQFLECMYFVAFYFPSACSPRSSIIDCLKQVSLARYFKKKINNFFDTSKNLLCTKHSIYREEFLLIKKEILNSEVVVEWSGVDTLREIES